MKLKSTSKNESEIDREWDRIVAATRKQAKKLGITEDDVDRLVHEVRHEIEAEK